MIYFIYIVVIGCIDGTHFGLQKTTENEHLFFNREEFHSLNSMIICDYAYRIWAINSKYVGAAHDSFVWKHSVQRHFLDEQYQNNNLKNCWLLGDVGFPVELWCITPYRSPAEGSNEAHFNEVHSKARCIVEMAIGILKGRWKILSNDKSSRYSPEKIALFGNAPAALHNICIQFKIPFKIPHVKYSVIPTELDIENETQLTRKGNKIRDRLKLFLVHQN